MVILPKTATGSNLFSTYVLHFLESESVGVGVYFDGVAVGESAGQKFSGKGIFKSPLLAAHTVCAIMLKLIVLFLNHTLSCAMLYY